MTDEITRFEIAKLELREGDKLVVRTDLMLTKDQAAYLKEKFERCVPDHEVIVCSGGLTLEVLRRTEQ